MSSRSAAAEPYSPVERFEARSQRVSELLIVAVAAAGLGLAGGRPGVVAAVGLLVCWLYLRAEVTFVVGAVLVAVVGGDPSAPGTVLTTAGLAGLLALDLARTWEAARPVGAFLATFAVGAAAFVVATEVVALRWVGAGAAVALVGALYGLVRVERRIVDREADDRADGSGQPRQGGGR